MENQNDGHGTISCRRPDWLPSENRRQGRPKGRSSLKFATSSVNSSRLLRRITFRSFSANVASGQKKENRIPPGERKLRRDRTAGRASIRFLEPNPRAQELLGNPPCWRVRHVLHEI